MRKLILLLILSVCALKSSHAQENYFGVRGGVLAGNIIVQPYYETKGVWDNFEFGLMYKLIAGDKYYGGFQTEVNYGTASFRLLEKETSDSSYVRSVTSIEIPFYWHPYYGFGEKEKVKLFLNAGPYLYYVMKSDYQYIDNYDLTSSFNRAGEYEFNRYFDTRFGYGVMGGAGVEVLIGKRLQLTAEFRYKFAFSDLWTYTGKVDSNLSEHTDKEIEQMYETTSYAQSQLTQMGVSVGLFYRFGRLGDTEKVKKKLKIKDKKE